MSRKLFSWDQGWVFEVELTPDPVAVALTHVNHEVLGQPLSSFASDLVEEPIVDDVLSVLVKVVKEHLNIVLAPSLALVLFNWPPLKTCLRQASSCFVVYSDNG